jgi:hypothetical protein
MTLIERLDADPFQVLSAMIRARPRHQRSIDSFFLATYGNRKMQERKIFSDLTIRSKTASTLRSFHIADIDCKPPRRAS